MVCGFFVFVRGGEKNRERTNKSKRGKKRKKRLTQRRCGRRGGAE
jgi:hypothetical protein